MPAARKNAESSITPWGSIRRMNTMAVSIPCIAMNPEKKPRTAPFSIIMKKGRSSIENHSISVLSPVRCLLVTTLTIPLNTLSKKEFSRPSGPRPVWL